MERPGVAGWVSKGFCVVSHFAKAGMIRFRNYVQDVRYIAIEHMEVRRDCSSLARRMETNPVGTKIYPTSHSVVLLALRSDEIRNTNTNKDQHR